MRRKKNGKLEVLLITSRDTGRWVLPKGWLMDGKTPWHAAEIEALEEAGVKGRIARPEIGTYSYDKQLDGGTAIPCEVRVYPLLVERLKRDWKERKDRERHWFSPKSAAEVVDEPELTKMLKSLGKAPEKAPGLKKLLKAS